MDGRRGSRGPVVMTGDSLAGCRILVVEDEMLIAVLIEQILEELRCVVVGPVAKLDAALRLASHEALDAAILDVSIRGGHVHPVAEQLLARGIPFVLVDRRIPGLSVDVVRCDSEAGAYQLSRHLLEQGHRRIAALSGSRQVTNAADRIAGYHRAMSESGLGDQVMEYYGEFSVNSGYEMTRQVLASRPLPTALLTGNNFIAVGAFRALHEAGLRVPDDISVVTFDDLPEANIINPFLTVVNQPAYEIGQRATALLLDRLANTAPPDSQEIILPTQLIVRKSSAPPQN